MHGFPPVRVVILGAGLAGMAAAIALESLGATVTLIEARQSAGGRAGSFVEPQTGEELDNCQHVLLGCCTNLIDFYRRIGVADCIHYDRTVYFRDGEGRRHDLWGINGWPAPLHLGLSMAAFGALSWRERLAASLGMLAMLRLGRVGRDKLADQPFGEWLDEHRQPASLVRKFYDPIIVSALNEETRRASSKYAIQVFQDAMLRNAAGYVVGLPACPLGQLYAKLPCRDFRLGTRASEVLFSGGKVAGVKLHTGEILTADAYIFATNHHAVQRWVPEGLAQTDSRFIGLKQLESVPILGAHLWFDRPIMTETHAALIEGPLQWLFRKNADGSALHGVISAARDWTSRPKEECLSLFERQIRSLFPAATGTVLKRGVIVVEKRATFSPSPGSDRLRPPQAPGPGGIPNLFLAGDYTQTDWPATMEGAVRSGYLAADSAARSLGLKTKRSFLVDDLPTEWPARWLAAKE